MSNASSNTVGYSFLEITKELEDELLTNPERTFIFHIHIIDWAGAAIA